MNQADVPEHVYSGARSLVQLHERHLKDFVECWKQAKAAGVSLPATTDQAYASLETLLVHVLSCAGRYMTWMCSVLELPGPGIDPVPGPDAVEAEADRYVAHLVERWRTPLAGVPFDRFTRAVHKSWWNIDYCVDAMLEHAVMHPIRHTHQLVILIRDAETDQT